MLSGADDRDGHNLAHDETTRVLSLREQPPGDAA